MINIETLIDLYKHMEWADATVWTTVMASESGQADAKVREYLYHLHVVQHAWFRAWQGESPGTSFPQFDDAESLMLWGQSYYGEAYSFLETLSDEKVSEVTPLPWAELVEKQLGRPPEATTLAETILQVALHSLYHRGQINARLRVIELEPPLVDHIAWVWFGRPSADWPDSPVE